MCVCIFMHVVHTLICVINWFSELFVGWVVFFVVVIVIVVAFHFFIVCVDCGFFGTYDKLMKVKCETRKRTRNNTHKHSEHCKQKRCLRQPHMQIAIRNYVTNALAHTPYFLFANIAVKGWFRLNEFLFASNWLMTHTFARMLSKMSLKSNDCCFMVELKPIITIHPARKTTARRKNSHTHTHTHRFNRFAIFHEILLSSFTC